MTYSCELESPLWLAWLMFLRYVMGDCAAVSYDHCRGNSFLTQVTDNTLLVMSICFLRAE